MQVPTSYVPFVVDGKPNPDFKYWDEWSVSALPGGAAAATLLSGAVTNNKTSPPPNVRVDVPPGTAFVTVNGTLRDGVGGLTVRWQGNIPPVVLESNPEAHDRTGYEPVVFTGSPYVYTQQLLYYAALNPAQTYVFTLRPFMGTPGTRVELHSVTFYSSSCVS
jgi:hypothetical protein